MSSITEAYTRTNRTTTAPGSYSDDDDPPGWKSYGRLLSIVIFGLIVASATTFLVLMFLWPDKPDPGPAGVVQQAAKSPQIAIGSNPKASSDSTETGLPTDRSAGPPALPQGQPEESQLAIKIYNPPVLIQGNPNQPAAPPAQGDHSVQTYFQAALTAKSQDMTGEAIQLFKKVIDLDPDHPEAYLHLGNLYFFQRQDIEKAQNMYREAVRIDQDNKIAYNNIGVTYLHQERYGKAEANFKAALKRDPGYVDALYNLACVATRQGRSGEAVNYLRSAAGINPEAASWAADDQDFETLKGNPEFDAFIRSRVVSQDQD